MARKRPAGTGSAGSRKRSQSKAKAGKVNARTASAGKAKAAKAKGGKATGGKAKPIALRTMDALGDAERVAVFDAVAKTLRAHGVADTLASLHFARNEFDLMCPDGQVRRMRCQLEGPTVVCEPVCEPE